jgi:tetratricopeptide (TPR) repeat protein
MGVRFRRSLKLGPGVRLNATKSGVGMSFGPRGLRYSVHSSGRQTRSIGIPGSGLSHVEVSAGSSRRRSVAPRQIVVPMAQASHLLPKPGWLSSKAEKRYYDGVQAYLRGEIPAALASFEACLAADPHVGSAHLFAVLCGEKTVAAEAEVIGHLEAIVEHEEPIPDRLQNKYLPPGFAALELSVQITENIHASAPFDSLGAALILAEHYQAAGRLEEAIGVVQQLHELGPADSAVRLSLADLYFADHDLEGVLEAASTATNDTDLGVELLHLRAAAMFALGHEAGAFEAFKEALAKIAGRDPELLKAVRYDRALAFERAGQKAKAKADLERIYAVDPSYEDVRDRLTAVTA